jgi:serine/threonine protein phosphatase 1
VACLSLLYAVGDIHGCHDQLLVAVAKIKAHAKARPYRVFFLGDYVDRGPKSREVVNLVKGLVTGKGTHGKWYALRGNHEEMMIAGMQNELDDFWLEYGGEVTRASYAGHDGDARDHLKWLATLPTLLETLNHCFVHAGCSPRYSLADQPDEVRMWIRGWEKDGHDFGKHVVYGHTISKVPRLLPFSTGLDTGAYSGGPLSVGVFDSAVNGGPVEILEAT